MERLGKNYWNDLPWQGKLGNDDLFRLLEAPLVVEIADSALKHFDDLVVVLLFSVFESIVREQTLTEVTVEISSLRHPVLQTACTKAVQSIEKGSIDELISFYKNSSSNMAEEVNQVRRYRNWVAHGKRGPTPPFVDPRCAYERLERFLEEIAPIGT